MGKLFGKRSEDITSLEVSTKHLTLRVVLFSVFLVLGIGAIIYGLVGLFSEEGGWQIVEAEAYANTDCSDEFVLQYELGAGDASPKAEYNQLSRIFGQVTADMYQLFSQNQLFDEVNNVAYLNEHPNETVQVDSVLYGAFETLDRAGNRQLFLAPYWEYYNVLFSCGDDLDAGGYDPAVNEELAGLFSEIEGFVTDDKAVSLELLGDSRVRLKVSEEYLRFAQERDIYCFIDFHFMKNAFIIDCLAEKLMQSGYTHGTVSSVDGFYRDLDDRGTCYSLNLFDFGENGAVCAAVMDYTDKLSIVSLRTFPVSEDNIRYYVYSNGSVRFPYLDMGGNCLAAGSNLVCYSSKTGCAELLMEMIPVYAAEGLDTGTLTAEFVYCKDNVIYHSDSGLVLAYIYEGYKEKTV